MTNTLSSSFSASFLDDVLKYAVRFQQALGFIVVVVDHMDERQKHITDLTSRLYLLLKKNIRPSDALIRLAPDCWLICLDGCDENFLYWAQYVLQSLLNRRSAQISSSLEGTLTCVKGTFIQTQNAKSAREAFESQIQAAKSALRRLKMIRSTALHSFPADPLPFMDLLPRIHKAVLDNRLFLAFQPIVDNQSGKLYYYECLARILDEQGHILQAGEFIPGCEKAGLIQLIDQKMQQLAVEELMGNRQLRLAINVSAITATDSLWLDTLKAQMTARPDLRDRLIVELTETSVFSDISESLSFINQLRNLGCHVSIDDFGAGYMSLTHLKPDLVQTVKIDAQFVKNLSPGSPNIHFIRAILALTQHQGIKCVAEGVENEKAQKILLQEKVDYLQGYHIGRPSHFRKWVYS